MILVVLAIISQLISLCLYPNSDVMLPLQHLLEQSAENGDSLQIVMQKISTLSETEKSAIVNVVIHYLLQLICVYIITTLITISVLLATIYNLTYKQLTLSTLLQNSLRIVPTLFLFMLLSIPYFFLLFLLAMMIPPLAIVLLLLGSLLYMAIYLLYLALTIEPVEKWSIFAKIRTSLILLKRHIRLILPMLGLWLITSILLNAFVETLSINNIIINIVANAINLLLNFIVICYFYRLYMLTNKA